MTEQETLEKRTRVDWLQVGKEHWEGRQEKIIQYCENIQWQEIPCEMGFMPGAAIKALIKEFKLPKVNRVACSHQLAPYGLVGIEAHYRNTDIQFFAVDEGSNIAPLCVFVYERGK